MANHVPFRKNKSGVWEIQRPSDGTWHTTPEWQSVLKNVRSVKAVTDAAGNPDYQFSWFDVEAGRVGTWNLADIQQMYATTTGTPIASGQQPTNIHEAWYASNTTSMPDIWMRTDMERVVEDQDGNPIIDPQKLERVIEILRQQGAWDMG